MNAQSVTALIERRIRELAAAKGAAIAAVTTDTPLVGMALPIDSLDLAALVVELEVTTGRQPFRNGLVEFHTVGDLAALFAADA